MEEHHKDNELAKEIEQSRQRREAKIAKLNSFEKGYDVDTFISDLESYFEGEVDFNLAKIKEEIARLGNLEEIVNSAIQNKTHPVVEFVQKMFKSLEEKE